MKDIGKAFRESMNAPAFATNVLAAFDSTIVDLAEQLKTVQDWLGRDCVVVAVCLGWACAVVCVLRFSLCMLKQKYERKYSEWQAAQ